MMIVMMMIMKVEGSRDDDDDANGYRLRSSFGDKDDAVYSSVGDDIFLMMLLLFCLSVSTCVQLY